MALVVVAYLPLWDGSFIWDDDLNITGNPHVQGGWEGLLRLWEGDSTDFYPLTWTLFWLEWHAWGPQPLDYHLTNVALHATGVILVWRILVRLDVPAAWLGAGLFALQPVNVASVAWITEGKNTLSLVFGAASALAFLRWRDGEQGYGLSLALYTAALLSKASVIPLPAVLGVLIWWKRGWMMEGARGKASAPM